MYALALCDEKRSRPLMEGKVNVGLIFRVMLGPHEAARYMAQANVPREIALRVLLEPHKCRYQAGLAKELAQIVPIGPCLVI